MAALALLGALGVAAFLLLTRPRAPRRDRAAGPRPGRGPGGGAVPRRQLRLVPPGRGRRPGRGRGPAHGERRLPHADRDLLPGEPHPRRGDRDRRLERDRLRQRDDPGDLSGRHALLPGVSLRLVPADAARGRPRPPGLPHEPARGALPADRSRTCRRRGSRGGAWGSGRGSPSTTGGSSPTRCAATSWNRGAYLANGPGHCGECHTPRTVLMAADESRHMAGGPHPGGEGEVPSLTGLVARGRYKDVGGPHPGPAVRRDLRLRQALERRDGRHPDEPGEAPRERRPGHLRVPAEPGLSSALRGHPFSPGVHISRTVAVQGTGPERPGLPSV